MYNNRINVNEFKTVNMMKLFKVYWSTGHSEYIVSKSYADIEKNESSMISIKLVQEEINIINQ